MECLVTRLKATVNNPDLPVIETMQQFTLDAIAASGNTLLTDTQKMALNHFFYKIGAIGNSGIWTKTKYLFLPMICNSVKDKVLVNYVDNQAIALSTKVNNNIAFSNKGCVYSEESNLFQEINSNETTDTNDLYMVLGFPEIVDQAGKSVGCFAEVKDSTIKSGITQLVASGIPKFNVLIHGLTFSYTKTDVTTPCGNVSSNNNGTYSNLLVGSSENYANLSPSGTENRPTAPYSLNVQFASVPVGILMFGSHLDEDEMTTLANAIRTFLNSFYAS